jgi:hypothetical protein
MDDITLNESFSQTEAAWAASEKPTWFEVVDWIPIASLVSSLVRGIFGIIETAVGLIALPFQLAARVCYHHDNKLLIVDGIANVIRAILAAEQIGGNIILYLYDHSFVFKRDLRMSAGI